MKQRKIIKIINIIFIAIFVIAAFNIGKIYYDYNKADDAYKEIQNKYVAANKQTSGNVQADNNEDEQSKTPESPIYINFDALLSRNKDVVGWLYCPDTIINYPVVIGKDNNEYLRRDLDKKYLVSGTLFADYRNSALDEGPNYIIYGHNMKNGTMFSTLSKYKTQAYFDKHPIMYYFTPEKSYKLELFAGLVIKRDDKIYIPNQNNQEFSELLKEYRAKSTFKSDVQVENDDIIVTLSTCSYEFDNARYILMGRLIPV